MAKKEPTYDEAQIAEKLKELPGWYLEDGWIRRVYKTDGWPTTLMLVNSIGYLSEAAYHREALHAQRRRDHRQGLCAGTEDRGRGVVAPEGR
jgi:4a-hydroxytetrahydrobiopterin dehydratase